ncbi:MAG: sulfurtransferase [Gammaproteobacteria bacterium]|nr:sulfurtransferase [Gammaproteobacteria bacterium]
MFKTLVDTATLSGHLDDPAWVVVDCRFTLTDTEAGARSYAVGHIPGARYAHLDRDLSSAIGPGTGRHPLPDPVLLAEKLGTWGIGDGKQVVVYDDSFGAMAARLWWLLRWLGHDAVALLDGGFPKWRRTGLPVTAVVPAPRPVRFEALRDDRLWVSSEFVRDAVTRREYLLIDARSEERFCGDIEPLDRVAGHVPGAVNLPFEDNLDLGGQFLAPQALRSLYLGVLRDLPSERVIQMCGSGVTACHNLLAMEHAGLHGAKLYAGSWSEWITDPRRPVASGEGEGILPSGAGAAG